MSEHTLCNHCTLRQIENDAPSGVVVTTRVEPGKMDPWIEVLRSDASEPIALFKQLTTHCVC